MTKSALTDRDKGVHVERIKRKDAVLTSYECVLSNAFEGIGYSYSEASDIWPSIADRFKAINKGIDYRTIYATLCSQAHNDPEDLLNDFLQVTQGPRGMEAQKTENENFSVFMFLACVALLIESSATYLAKYTPDAKHVLMGLAERANVAALEAVGQLRNQLH